MNGHDYHQSTFDHVRECHSELLKEREQKFILKGISNILTL